MCVYVSGGGGPEEACRAAVGRGDSSAEAACVRNESSQDATRNLPDCALARARARMNIEPREAACTAVTSASAVVRQGASPVGYWV